jgi:hypothetical protein
MFSFEVRFTQAFLTAKEMLFSRNGEFLAKSRFAEYGIVDFMQSIPVQYLRYHEKVIPEIFIIL